MTDKIVVLSTCGSAEEAERVGRALVESKLAACVNVVPGIRSIYEWQGAIEDATEWLLVIKSRRDLFARLNETLRRVHSYQVPEAIALPVVEGSEDYLSWMNTVLASGTKA